ncbi:MAG TPA: tRNA uridine-5-carboxymethylaminomethyl(34) synthesis enzyme MnmG [Clostridiales bacterium]|nr:tRNA uridine-5-carboxymethylaminomethyl(34) synthesis enzyme MnmG [Clostridiales bacterium]
MRQNIIKDYDAVVVGAGHAGCEAALALARTGIKTIMLTLSLDSIGFLACNPSIGGTAKGQIVGEIDALGGEMGKMADRCAILMRMLNTSKGPAVQSLRAQEDKTMYHQEMKKVLENTPNLDIKQAEVTEILHKNGKIYGVKTELNEAYYCKAVVLCTGVYLKSNIIIGNHVEETGPNGFKRANKLTKSLIKCGFEIFRFKTGTPTRVNFDTVDTSGLEIQYGDENILPFSRLTKKQPKNKAVCYLTYTNLNTHKIIMDNIKDSPIYSGLITGVGPRYCPSIETKIVRFKDKERHQLFLEPEGLDTKETYVQGLSTSLPTDVQKEMLHSIAGLENAKIMRDAYAIEYDCINSLQLYPTLEYKNIDGIYCAGQINGTSGYEEAGCQGLIAGINASLKIRGKEQLVLKRDEAFIGVLIDDLVTKGTDEPYRMLTSRAEYRLHLRQDNCDLRLTEIGRSIGLVDDERYKIFLKKQKDLKRAEKELVKIVAPSKSINEMLEGVNEAPLQTGASVKNLLKRTSVTAKMLKDAIGVFRNFNDEILQEITIQTKYEGYIEKEQVQIEDAKRQEKIVLPQNFDYSTILGLRLEAREKLNKVKPLNMGQASRISGVSPADIAVLTVYLKSKKML